LLKKAIYTEGSFSSNIKHLSSNYQYFFFQKLIYSFQIPIPMARRTFTNIVLALGLLCSIAASTAAKAQQVTFAISPTQVTPAVGDTLKLNVTVQNFTNIVSFQYGIEWDGALLSYVGLDSVSIPDQANFLPNPVGGNSVLVGWNSSGAAKSATNGQRIFRLRLKVLAASSNYWAKFSNSNLDIEVIQDPGLRAVTPVFVNLGTPPGTTTIPVGAKVTSVSTLTAQKVCVPVTATDFTGIVSAKWVNKWNAAVLRFDSVSTLNNALGLTLTNFGATQASTGRLAFAWNAAGAGVSVSNNDTLYKVCYTAIGANGTNSAITFDSSAVYRRGSGGDALVALNGVTGTVTVGAVVLPPTVGLTFAASNLAVTSGDTACVRIKVGSFTDIAVSQWSMHWDSTKMTLLSATSNAGLGIAAWTSPTTQGDFNNLINGSPSGTLRFLWVSPSGNGYTLADSTVMMELCFKYIGAGGTNSTLRFDGTPLKIQVKDGNLVSVTPIFRAGNVAATTASLPTAFTSVVKNVTCPSGADGTITLTPTGGNGTYTYSWTGPSGFAAASKDVAARIAGKYYVTVTSNATTKVDSFTIAEPAAFATSTQLTQVSCKGGNNGAIALTATGGTTPYTYAWVGTTTTPTAKDLANLTAGIYKLTLTDAKNCTTTRADTIKEPAAALAATTVATNINCKSGRDGSITTTVTGGTTPYSYSWVSANGTIANTKDLATLAAGTYNLTVTDAKSCTTTRSETLIEPDSISIGSAVIVGTLCSQSTGKITVSTITGGSGGFTYAWTGPNGATFATQNLTNIAPGQYVLTVKDSKNCTASASFTVVDVAANITSSVPTVTNILCNGGNGGAISLTATGSGPLTYSWTGPNGFTANTLAISTLKAGNYTLVITDAGCSKTIAATVTEPTALATAPTTVNVKCKGESSGSIALNASGGTGVLTITWTGPNGFTATGQSISNRTPGTYVATIVDANLCQKIETLTITEPADALKIVTANVTNVACKDGVNGAIALTVANGTPQYSYAWTGVAGFTSTQKDISNLRGGDYSVTVKDANSCTVQRTLSVIEPTAIVIVASTTDASGTPNGTITLSVTGGQSPYTFGWTGQGVAPTAQNQTGLCPGTYNVAVKDNAQCPASKAVTVGGACSTPMRIIGLPTSVPAGCVGQNLGQITINWEGGVAPFTVVWVTIPLGTPIFTDPTQARSSTLTSRPAGTYAVKITDAVGQTLATPPIVINGSATPLSVTAAITNETCRGNDGSIALTITDGAAPYKVKWSDLSPTFDLQTRPNLTAGLYKATVSDANGCLKPMDDMVVRRTPCPLTISTTKTNPKCFGGTDGSITINISNGEPVYTVTLPNGTITTINNVNSRTGTYTLNGLGTGTYTIAVKDTTNPIQNFTISLQSPDQIVVNKSITGDQGTCTGSIVLTPTGGVPNYRYEWNTGATSRDLFNLCCNDGRRYSVRVTDANGCMVATSNDSIVCNIATFRIDSGRVSDAACASDATNSRLEVFVRGGVQPYIYEWRNQTGGLVGNNSPILSNQLPGRYYLTVYDSRSPNPQRLSYDAALKIKSTLAILTVPIDASDNVTKDGGTTVTITPGAGPYSIRWQDGSTSTTSVLTATNNALFAGTAELTVTDLQGCVVKQNVTIGSRACATIRTNTIYFSAKDTVNIKCADNSDGGATVLSLNSSYALPIRSYQWNSGEVGSTAFKLSPGFNQVTITDANGKTCVSRVFMKAPALLKDTVWVDDKARTLEAVPSGGLAPYTYLWTTDNADQTRKVSVTRTGTYFVVITDSWGCKITDKGKIIFNAQCLEGSIILSPNDDGRNENFRIKSCDLKKVRLEVYNRWGQLVYESNDYREQWYGNKEDGPSGNPLPQGVYMYILSATDTTGKVQIGKGTVNIVRD
jgi:gliding motility-associated-like protein